MIDIFNSISQPTFCSFTLYSSFCLFSYSSTFLSRMQEYRLDKVHVYDSEFFSSFSFPFLFSVFFPISPFVVLVNFRYYRVTTKKLSYRENTRLAHFLQTNASSFISRPFFFSDFSVD